MTTATAATTAWDKEAIQALLARNDKAVIRALLQIWARQTPSEKSARDSRTLNDVGFTAADAPKLSRIAMQVARGMALSPGEIDFIRPRIMKYHRQLLDIVMASQLAQLQQQQ